MGLHQRAQLQPLLRTDNFDDRRSSSNLQRTYMLSVIAFLTVTLFAAGITLVIAQNLLKKQALLESSREEACRQLAQKLALRCLASKGGPPTTAFRKPLRSPFQPNLLANSTTSNHSG
jgi:hypothetical protein